MKAQEPKNTEYVILPKSEHAALLAVANACDNLQKVVIKMLAGGYNGKAREMHSVLGNNAIVAQNCLAAVRSNK